MNEHWTRRQAPGPTLLLCVLEKYYLIHSLRTCFPKPCFKRGLPLSESPGPGQSPLDFPCLMIATEDVPGWSQAISIPRPPTRTALDSSLGSLNRHYNPHWQKTESQSQRGLLRAAQPGQAPLAPWPLAGALLAVSQPLLWNVSSWTASLLLPRESALEVLKAWRGTSHGLLSDSPCSKSFL